MKKVLLIGSVIIAGLLAGYFSTPIYNLIWRPEVPKPAVVNRSDPGPAEPGGRETGNEYISKEAAVSAVKDFSPIETAIGLAKQNNFQLSFSADQEPDDTYPVWLVEVKEIHPERVPTVRYFQVDAVTGKVLDLQQEELKISGIGLGMSRRETASIQGKPIKTKRTYDQNRKQNIRIDSYPGLDIAFNPKEEVVKVTASRLEHRGPRGVKKGDSKEEVIKLLGRAGTVLTDLLEYRPVDGTATWFVLKFDSSGNVVELSMENAVS